jgi:CheY-like chemotaxis protein
MNLMVKGESNLHFSLSSGLIGIALRNVLHLLCTRALRPTLGVSWGSQMGFQILVVDDNPSVRKCIRTFIELQTDWNVCGEAENGQIAIERVKDLNPDLVVLDLSMPVMNGLDAARQISNVEPRLPLIMLTMYVLTDSHRQPGRQASRMFYPKSWDWTICWFR